MIEFCKTIDFKFQSGATAFYNVSHTSINVLNFKFQSGATALGFSTVFSPFFNFFKFQSGATALKRKNNHTVLIENL